MALCFISVAISSPNLDFSLILYKERYTNVKLLRPIKINSTNMLFTSISLLSEDTCRLGVRMSWAEPDFG